MRSTVDVCNAALSRLGAALISDLSEATAAARACAERYGPARDAVLRAHPWNCALRRASLARLAEPPAFGFARQFALPADWLRVVAVDGGAPFRLEGGRLLSDADAVSLLYVRRIEDASEFDALLAETVASRLAAELAYPLVNSSELSRTLWQLHEERLREARRVDAQEGGEVRAPAFGGAWTAARRTGA